MPDTLAFVTPWYGRDIAGGAEAECRATARALRSRGVPVEILTTCALDHGSPWSDHHPEGVTEEDGFVVRRFKVRPRDPERYGQLQWRFTAGGTLTSFEEEDFVRESINSDALYAYLGAERDRYWYAFIPYCFGTTWEGALVAPERSLLIPCLHDEPFAQALPAISRRQHRGNVVLERPCNLQRRRYKILRHVGLIGKIDARFDECERLDQLCPPVFRPIPQCPRHLPECLPTLPFGLGHHQIGKAFHRS